MFQKTYLYERKRKYIILVAISCKKFINSQKAKSQPEDATAQSSSIP